jgi:hypothetical protein
MIARPTGFKRKVGMQMSAIAHGNHGFSPAEWRLSILIRLRPMRKAVKPGSLEGQSFVSWTSCGNLFVADQLASRVRRY